MKKIIGILTAVIMVFSVPVEASEASLRGQPEELYHLISAGNYDLFTNYVDGYEMFVDRGMSVDTDYFGVAAVLENETKRIEIYKQNLSGISKSGYINYSNQFLKNTADHYGIVQQTEEIGGRSIQITAWERNKLARVSNDKNYYVCLEIQEGSNVYTIFVKSAVPIAENGGYRYLAENFQLIRSTKSGFIRMSETIPAEEKGWNAETYEFYQKYFNDEASLSWGIFEPDVDYTGYDTLYGYERTLDYIFPVLLSYTEVINTAPEVVKNRLENAYENGKVLELTLQTAHASNNMIYNLLNGQYDSYLYEYASVISEFGHPVLFRLFNEMNGDWCPYSSYNTSKDTMLFKEAYRYIYSIFDSAGANENTIWIWNPNSESYPDFNWNHALMYYPGDEYVDVIGLTAYNTGTYYSGEKWQSFSELYDNLYSDYCQWFSQPFMITEFASSSVGGDKAAWIDDMFLRMQNFSRIKIAIWWDGCDWDANGNIARPYFLDETQDTLEAFRKGIRSSWNVDVYA